MKFINLGILLLISYTTTSIAISCYQCKYVSTSPDNNCYGPDMSSLYLVNCSSNYDYCYTGVGKNNFIGTGFTSIIRSCYDTDIGIQCKSGVGTQICYYTCSTDGCNIGN